MAHDTEGTPRKERRGRPPKPDALTPAERAKRYRDRKKGLGPIEPSESATLEEKVQLQLKLDQERMKVMLLENQLRECKRKTAAPSGPNPLAKQVSALLTRIREQDKIISACNAEISKLRNDIASRK